MNPKSDSSSLSAQRLGCLALGLVALLVVTVLLGSWALVAALGFDRAAPIIAGVGTAVFSLISFLVSKQLERQREIEQELRRSKVPFYEKFIAFWLQVMMAGKPGIKKVPEAEASTFFAASTQQLIVWAPDEVLQRYVRFRMLSLVANDTPEAKKAMAVAFGELLLAIRKDMGHSNQGISVTDVFSTFINDAGSYFAP